MPLDEDLWTGVPSTRSMGCYYKIFDPPLRVSGSDPFYNGNPTSGGAKFHIQTKCVPVSDMEHLNNVTEILNLPSAQCKRSSVFRVEAVCENPTYSSQRSYSFSFNNAERSMLTTSCREKTPDVVTVSSAKSILRQQGGAFVFFSSGCPALRDFVFLLALVFN